MSSSDLAEDKAVVILGATPPARLQLIGHGRSGQRGRRAAAGTDESVPGGRLSSVGDHRVGCVICTTAGGAAPVNPTSTPGSPDRCRRRPAPGRVVSGGASSLRRTAAMVFAISTRFGTCARDIPTSASSSSSWPRRSPDNSTSGRWSAWPGWRPSSCCSRSTTRRAPRSSPTGSPASSAWSRPPESRCWTDHLSTGSSEPGPVERLVDPLRP